MCSVNGLQSEEEKTDPYFFLVLVVGLIDVCDLK